MNDFTRWIDLEGAVNVRDLGGLATVDGGTTRPGRLYRSDNLQGLTEHDIELLVGELKLRHVVDLRSGAEVSLEGPGPLMAVPEVSIHHHTLFAEGGRHTDVEADTIDADKVLPWQERVEEDLAELRVTGFYYAYLRDRPDSVLAALRAMARDDGAAVVHCAAGKDRTGVVCALALEVAGATREAIVADYTATGERLEGILARLRSSATYRDDLDSRPADDHRPRPEYIEQFLRVLDDRFGGPLPWLASQGWTEADSRSLRSRLRD
ncbi:tyrosine-protein phosphatase [Streptosporangium roseum]|uniref:Protein tyrosine/serine phosphatase n=1 Tax=Streptosporangium roseum (strain ATCC 12428 / DSM 43021 / JCM 3005 / KCTC 9067 / NCIMB 10171 / NRRL 2505 / NI 9100) TaxID=479432 RepID=D2B751_STRRD|nr:tyrosine-protein phosphatase [Streptosporangium roseum]ACZ89576.1 protein tyrosine/serine phosphatase [Streptosporangium roseum DSM 43021]